MLKHTVVALSLIVAAGAASTTANAGDYRYGSYSRDRYDSRHDYAPRHYRPYHLSDGYRSDRWHAWREHRQHRRYARWWRRDY